MKYYHLKHTIEKKIVGQYPQIETYKKNLVMPTLQNLVLMKDISQYPVN